jgi:integrase
VSKAQQLRVMRALFSWARGKGWMTIDITGDVEVDPGPQETRPYLQPNEIPVFLDGCTPAHRIRAGLILATGLRADEAAHLRWSWVVSGIGRPSIRVPAHDLETGFFSKGRRARALPLSAQAQAVLEEAAARWGRAGYVLHDQEQPPATSNWCRQTHRACRKARVTDVDTHGLRRTAGVLWLSCGLDIFEVSRLLGHQSVTTTERSYVGISHGQLAAAMDAVDARMGLPTVGGKVGVARDAHRDAHHEKRAPESPEALEIFEPTPGFEPGTC